MGLRLLLPSAGNFILLIGAAACEYEWNWSRQFLCLLKPKMQKAEWTMDASAKRMRRQRRLSEAEKYVKWLATKWPEQNEIRKLQSINDTPSRYTGPGHAKRKCRSVHTLHVCRVCAGLSARRQNHFKFFVLFFRLCRTVDSCQFGYLSLFFRCHASTGHTRSIRIFVVHRNNTTSSHKFSLFSIFRLCEMRNVNVSFFWLSFFLSLIFMFRPPAFRRMIFYFDVVSLFLFLSFSFPI